MKLSPQFYRIRPKTADEFEGEVGAELIFQNQLVHACCSTMGGCRFEIGEAAKISRDFGVVPTELNCSF